MEKKEQEIVITKHDLDLISRGALEFFNGPLPKNLSSTQLQILMVIHGFKMVLSKEDIRIKIIIDL